MTSKSVHWTFRNNPPDYNSKYNLSVDFNIKYSGTSLSVDEIDSMKLKYENYNWTFGLKNDFVNDTLRWLGYNFDNFYSTGFSSNGSVFPVDSFLLYIRFKNGEILQKPFSTSVPGSRNTKGYKYVYTEDYKGSITASFTRAIRRPPGIALFFCSETITVTFTVSGPLVYNGYVSFTLIP